MKELLYILITYFLHAKAQQYPVPTTATGGYMYVPVSVTGGQQQQYQPFLGTPRLQGNSYGQSGVSAPIGVPQMPMFQGSQQQLLQQQGLIQMPGQMPVQIPVQIPMQMVQGQQPQPTLGFANPYIPVQKIPNGPPGVQQMQPSTTPITHQSVSNNGPTRFHPIVRLLACYMAINWQTTGSSSGLGATAGGMAEKVEQATGVGGAPRGVDYLVDFKQCTTLTTTGAALFENGLFGTGTNTPLENLFQTNGELFRQSGGLGLGGSTGSTGFLGAALFGGFPICNHVCSAASKMYASGNSVMGAAANEAKEDMKDKAEAAMGLGDGGPPDNELLQKSCLRCLKSADILVNHIRNKNGTITAASANDPLHPLSGSYSSLFCDSRCQPNNPMTSFLCKTYCPDIKALYARTTPSFGFGVGGSGGIGGTSLLQTEMKSRIESKVNSKMKSKMKSNSGMRSTVKGNILTQSQQLPRFVWNTNLKTNADERTAEFLYNNPVASPRGRNTPPSPLPLYYETSPSANEAMSYLTCILTYPEVEDIVKSLKLNPHLSPMMKSQIIEQEGLDKSTMLTSGLSTWARRLLLNCEGIARMTGIIAMHYAEPETSNGDVQKTCTKICMIYGDSSFHLKPVGGAGALFGDGVPGMMENIATSGLGGTLGGGDIGSTVGGSALLLDPCTFCWDGANRLMLGPHINDTTIVQEGMRKISSALLCRQICDNVHLSSSSMMSGAATAAENVVEGMASGGNTNAHERSWLCFICSSMN
eukprot:g1471.t1